jgi:hypothetical protein
LPDDEAPDAKATEPLSPPYADAPVEIDTKPDEPELVEPLPIYNEPLFPELALPVLNTN